MEDGKVNTTDTAEAVGAETPAEKVGAEATEETMDNAFKEGETAGTEDTGQQIPWDKYGLPNFVGRKPQEVADYLNRQFRQFGNQANELGKLRKQVEEYEQLKASITGQKPSVSQEVEKMDDYELAAFADMFNSNPYAAIQKFIGPKLKPWLKEELMKDMKDDLGNVLDERTQHLTNKQEYEAFAKEFPDHAQYSDLMKQLMTEQYLGDDAPYKDVYHLAVLSQKEASLFQDTLEMMQHGFSFERAKEIALLKQSAPQTAQNKTEQVMKEVAEATVAGKRSGTKAATAEPDIKTMDDAFA